MYKENWKRGHFFLITPYGLLKESKKGYLGKQVKNIFKGKNKINPTLVFKRQERHREPGTW